MPGQAGRRPTTRALVRADLLRFTAPRRRHREITASRSQILRAALPQQGSWAVVEFRVRQRLRRTTGPLRAPARALAFVTKRVAEILTGISISNDARFGPGLYIGHFGGIVIGAATVGEDFNLSQGVTIGAHRDGTPTIGDAVYVAPGAKLFGAITVGDHAIVGANAVVQRDVAPRTSVGGIPATPIGDGGRERW